MLKQIVESWNYNYTVIEATFRVKMSHSEAIISSCIWKKILFKCGEKIYADFLDFYKRELILSLESRYKCNLTTS